MDQLVIKATNDSKASVRWLKQFAKHSDLDAFWMVMVDQNYLITIKWSMITQTTCPVTWQIFFLCRTVQHQLPFICTSF